MHFISLLLCFIVVVSHGLETLFVFPGSSRRKPAESAMVRLITAIGLAGWCNHWLSDSGSLKALTAAWLAAWLAG